MKRTWIEEYAGETYQMKTVRFGKWAVEFGMNVKNFPKGWNFNNVVKNWSGFNYRGHVGRMRYCGIEVSAKWVSDVFTLLYMAYEEWERANKKIAK